MIADTETIIAINPPFEISIDPVLSPEAPAVSSAAVDPEEAPASPAVGPEPGCCGDDVARAEKTDAMVEEVIAGIWDFVVLGCAKLVAKDVRERNGREALQVDLFYSDA